MSLLVIAGRPLPPGEEVALMAATILGVAVPEEQRDYAEVEEIIRSWRN